MRLIPKETPQKVLPNFRFRSIFHYINDSPYTSIEEAPINGSVKEALKTRKGVSLFFGFSEKIQQEVFQCLAIEKKFQTHLVDIDQFILRQTDVHFFDSLPPEPLMILVKNIELLREEAQIAFLLQGIEKVLQSPDSKEIILQSQKPYEIHSEILQKIDSFVFFDFPTLKSIKLMLTNEIIKVESQYRNMEFESVSVGDQDEEDEEDEEDEVDQVVFLYRMNTVLSPD